MQELDVALQDIASTLKTGKVLSRQDRTVIPSVSFPADWLSSDPYVQDFVKIAKRGISVARRSLLIVTSGTGDPRILGDVSNLNKSAPAHEWMRRVNKVDQARNKILKAANTLIAHAGLEPFDNIPLSFSPAEIKAVRP